MPFSEMSIGKQDEMVGNLLQAIGESPGFLKA
jgi:hypothetical protein